jgi:hypothetical protein
VSYFSKQEDYSNETHLQHYYRVQPVAGYHNTPAADHKMCNRMGTLEKKEKSVTWINASIPGAESSQTGPICCHSVLWC